MEINIRRFLSALLSHASPPAGGRGFPILAPKEAAALLDVCDALRAFATADLGARLFLFACSG